MATATTSNQNLLKHQANFESGSAGSGNPRCSVLIDITVEVKNPSGLYDKHHPPQQILFQVQHQPQKPLADPQIDPNTDPHGDPLPNSTISDPLSTDPEDIAGLWEAVSKNCEPTGGPSNITTMSEETQHPFDPQGFALPSFRAILALYNIRIKSAEVDKARRVILLSSHNMNPAKPGSNGEATAGSEATEKDKATNSSKSAQKNKTADIKPNCQSLQKLQSGDSSVPRPLYCGITSEKIEKLAGHLSDMRACISIGDIKELLNTAIFLNRIEDDEVFQVKATHRIEMLSSIDLGYLLPPRIEDLSTNTQSSKTAKLAQKSVKKKEKSAWTSARGRLVPTISGQTRPTEPSASPNLCLWHPLVEIDFAYWLKLTVFKDYSNLPSTPTGLTSPYLTVTFDDIPVTTDLSAGLRDPRMYLPILSQDMRILYVEHKLAVHGAAALYNLWRSLTDKEAGQILHFGITITTTCRFQVFVFEPIKTTKNEWAGCDMVRIAHGTMTCPPNLRELVDIYNDIQEWGIGAYAEGIRKAQ